MPRLNDSRSQKKKKNPTHTQLSLHHDYTSPSIYSCWKINCSSKSVWWLKRQPSNLTEPFYKVPRDPLSQEALQWFTQKPFTNLLTHQQSMHKAIQCKTPLLDFCIEEQLAFSTLIKPSVIKCHMRSRTEEMSKVWADITPSLRSSPCHPKPPSGIITSRMKIQQKQTAFNTSLPNVHLLTHYQTNKTKKLLMQCCASGFVQYEVKAQPEENEMPTR